jgi:hypothetical protein
MKTFKALLAASLLLALATGCTSTSDNEHMLSAAGFKMMPANTPQRQAHLRSLPADTITPVQVAGDVYYTFPDPQRNVLFVGQEPQYQEYQRLRFQNQATMQQELQASRTVQGESWFGDWGLSMDQGLAAQ